MTNFELLLGASGYKKPLPQWVPLKDKINAMEPDDFHVLMSIVHLEEHLTKKGMLEGRYSWICNECGHDMLESWKAEDKIEEGASDSCEICGKYICRFCYPSKYAEEEALCNECHKEQYGKPIKSGIKPSLRFKVLKRDKYKCRLCGKTVNEGAMLEVDHKIPKSKGGKNNLGNLWTLCFDCNRGKGVTLI